MEGAGDMALESIASQPATAKECLDALLTTLNSSAPRDAADAQVVIDELDSVSAAHFHLCSSNSHWVKMLAIVPKQSVEFTLGLKRLKRFCREHVALPSTCLITDDVVPETNIPLHQTNFSDVYRGRHQGELVAMKRLRVREDTKLRVAKVGVQRCYLSSFLF
jgi:hypothetical protein